jgi:hypothetical protein
MDVMVSFSGEDTSRFNIKAYSTVSSILRRVSKLKKHDRKIKKQIGKIQDSINKGQRQILSENSSRNGYL